MTKPKGAPDALPDKIKEAIEDIAIKRYVRNTDECVEPRCDTFLDGASALYSHLLQLAGEFDRKAAIEAFQTMKDPIYGITDIDALDLAKWQFERSQAQTAALKMEVAEQREVYDREMDRCMKAYQERDALKLENEKLKKELSEINDDMTTAYMVGYSKGNEGRGK